VAEPNVWLFKTFHGVGAFAIGPIREERSYYRGSTDEEIAATIEKAIKASKKAEPEASATGGSSHR
jgi:hypothetical protein